MNGNTQNNNRKILVIGFDADDTLWYNETLFVATKDKFKQLLARYHNNSEQIAKRLDEMEIHNLQYFGYGIKSFAISMIEAAIELSDGKIQAKEIQAIVALAKEMIAAPVQLFEQVKEVVTRLSAAYKLLLITKGDLFDQERKVAHSGIAQYFTYIEVVSDKTPEIYKALLTKHQIAPQHFLMVGNSLRSDILPVLAIGGQAVFIPYHLTWEHENVVEHHDNPGEYFECEQIGLLPSLIEHLNNHRGLTIDD